MTTTNDRAIANTEAARTNQPSDHAAEARAKAVTDCECLASELDKAMDRLRASSCRDGRNGPVVDWQVSIWQSITAFIEALS